MLKCTFMFIALLIGMLWALPTMAAPAANLRIAKIAELSGEVKVLKTGGERQFRAFKGMGLSEGDSIITGKDASVSVQLDEWKDIRIGGNSHVLISELKEVLETNSEQTTFSLLAGGLWGSIRKQLNLDSRFQIKTPTAVMGIRGTELYVRHSEEGTQVDLIEGEIMVASVQTVENEDGTTDEQRVETVMRAGQHIYLAAPAKDIADFIFEELTQDGLDDFALEMMQEIAETRPDVVTPETAEEVRRLVQQRQEQKGDEQPAPAPPNTRIIYDETVIPPAEPVVSEPVIPAINLLPIANQDVAVGATVDIRVPVSPSQAQLSVEYQEGVLSHEIVPATHTQFAELRLTGVTVGTHTVTVRASSAGYHDAVRTFEVTVIEAPIAPAGPPRIAIECESPSVTVGQQFSLALFLIGPVEDLCGLSIDLVYDSGLLSLLPYYSNDGRMPQPFRPGSLIDQHWTTAVNTDTPGSTTGYMNYAAVVAVPNPPASAAPGERLLIGEITFQALAPGSVDFVYDLVSRGGSPTEGNIRVILSDSAAQYLPYETSTVQVSIEPAQ